MVDTLQLKENIYWVGAQHPELKVFDIIMETEFGTSYNSYLVKGSEKVALFETVKVKFFDQYVAKLKQYVDLKDIAYIVVDHTEPDHVGSVEKLLDLTPNASVVGSQAAIDFLKEITNKAFPAIVVDHNDTLSLGDKTLQFISAPFLHWPDSIYTYIPEDQVLLTCDSFGAHYACDEVLFSKLPESKMADYKSALLYYYTAIFGPFKKYVLEALEKVKNLDINMVCTGHGPVLDQNPRQIMDIYKKWSTTAPKDDQKRVVIPYVSAYGYTEELALRMAAVLRAEGIEVTLYNLHIQNYGGLKEEVLKKIAQADGVLLGTSTINGDALPLIWDLGISLNPIVHGGKIASAFGSYGWSGEGVPNIIDRLDQLRMGVLDGFTINFKGSNDELKAADEFAKVFAKAVLTGALPPRKFKESADLSDLNPSREVKKWRCIVCGEVFEGIYPPIPCPACGAGVEMFQEIIEDRIDFSSDLAINVVIIGNSAAGVAAAEAIRLRNSVATIEMISDEPVNGYYRPSLSKYLAQPLSDNDFFLKPPKWYEENCVKRTLGQRVVAVDRSQKTVLLQDGSDRSYDKLVVATGARCFIPPIENHEQKGVYILRSIADRQAISTSIADKKRAIVIGGGILGLETAWELKKLGLEVMVVEVAERIFPRQLDECGSTMLETALKEKKIAVYKGVFAKKITGDGVATGVILSDGRELLGDLIVVSAGIRSNIELAVKADLPVGRGVEVNRAMTTIDPDIYAAGDVAEYRGIICGSWPVAVNQGKVAGANIVGDKERYNFKWYPVVFRGMDQEIFSIGQIDFDQNGSGFTYQDQKKGVYKRLFFKDEVLVGAVLMGDLSWGNKLEQGINNQCGPEILATLIK